MGDEAFNESHCSNRRKTIKNTHTNKFPSNLDIKKLEQNVRAFICTEGGT